MLLRGICNQPTNQSISQLVNQSLSFWGLTLLQPTPTYLSSKNKQYGVPQDRNAPHAKRFSQRVRAWNLLRSEKVFSYSYFLQHVQMGHIGFPLSYCSGSPATPSPPAARLPLFGEHNVWVVMLGLSSSIWMAMSITTVLAHPPDQFVVQTAPTAENRRTDRESMPPQARLGRLASCSNFW